MSVYVCVYDTCAYVHENQKRTSGPGKLEFYVFMRCPVRVLGSKFISSRRAPITLNPCAILLAPSKTIFNIKNPWKISQNSIEIHLMFV